MGDRNIDDFPISIEESLLALEQIVDAEKQPLECDATVSKLRTTSKPSDICDDEKLAVCKPESRISEYNPSNIEMSPVIYEKPVLNEESILDPSKAMDIFTSGQPCSSLDESQPEMFDETCFFSDMANLKISKCIKAGFCSLPTGDYESITKILTFEQTLYRKLNDEGLCIVVPQPYVSLIISGLISHIGMQHDVMYRGRLWIQSSKRVISHKIINRVESIFRDIAGIRKLPSKYLAGYLHGCFNVVNCLPQVEYRKLYPQGENVAPFVLLCEDCRELRNKIEMGDNKGFFKLEAKVHAEAKSRIFKHQ